MKGKYHNDKGLDTTKYPECIFTPRKGTWSCRGCRFSPTPELYDPACLIPPEMRQRAARGEITEREIWDYLEKRNI